LVVVIVSAINPPNNVSLISVPLIFRRADCLSHSEATRNTDPSYRAAIPSNPRIQ
jgi:hypothetical protein